jgi:hypothetical protein
VREASKNNEEDQAYLASVEELAESFRDTSAPEIAMRFDVVFGKGTHSLRSLFKDEQRKILELVLAPLTEESEAAHIQLYERSADLMRFLTDLHIPIPKPSRASAEFALNHHLRREFLSEEPSLERVAPLIEEARAAKIDLDVATLEYALRRRLEQMAETLSDLRSDPAPLARFHAAVELARALPFPVNLWQVQNVFYDQLRSLTRSRRMSAGEPPQDASRWAGELARVGETLLFTPEALNLVFHSTAAD